MKLLDLRRALVLGLVVAGATLAGAQRSKPFADEWLAKPVEDRIFRTYLDFFTYDRRVPFDLRVSATDEEEGIKREHLSFQSTAGVRVLAHFYQPAGSPSQKSPCLILLHGGIASGKNGVVAIARNLARAGWNVLALDMQYFGERSTDLFTTFTEQEKHERLYNQPSLYLAWVAQTVKDVGRSFDLLVEQKHVDPKRIGLFGGSRGAIVGAIAGAVDHRLAAVVMGYGGHFDALEREHLAAACPANYIGRISPRPLLMLNGSYDTDMIKDTSVEPLYRLAKQPKQILWSEGGHGAPSEQNQALMFQWLREHLK